MASKQRSLSRKHIYALALGVAALALAGVLFVYGQSEEGYRIPSDLSKVDPSLADSGKIDDALFRELLSYRLIRGKVYSYSFDRQVRATLLKKDIVNMNLAGTLEVHVVRTFRNSMDLLIIAEFSRVEGVEGMAEQKGPVQNKAVIRIDSTGNLAALRFTPDMADPSKQGLINDLIASWLKNLNQAVVPPGEKADPTSFVVQGTDLNGVYNARLTAQARDKNPALLDLTKLAYILSPSNIEIQESEHNLAWNLAKGHPVYLVGDEVLRLGPKEMGLVSSHRYRYAFAGIDDSPYSSDDLLAYTSPSKLYQEAYASDRPDSGPPPMTADQIQKDLASIDGLKQEDQFKLLGNMIHSFRRDSSIAKRVISSAATMPSESTAFRFTLGAASAAGDLESQNGLRRLFGDGQVDEQGKQAVVQSFTLMQVPISEDNRNFLRGIYNNPPGGNADLRMSASLALGTALRNSDDSAIRNLIEKEWRAARTTEEKLFVLEMIGNSGDPTFFPFIRESMRAQESIMRQKAIYGTRFMEDPVVNQFILNTLASAAEPPVRELAMDSLGMHAWRDHYYEPMATCVTQEVAAAIRMKCADYAFSQPTRMKSMKSLLESILPGEKDAGFRTYIKDKVK